MVNQCKTGPYGPYDAPALLRTLGDVFGVVYKGVNSGRWWVTNPYLQVLKVAL